MHILKPILAAAVLATVALSPSPARADMCALDDRPAATLLVPYFEVALDQPQSQRATTHVWVRNTAQRPKLAQITVWSDWGIPVTAFYVYLPAMAAQRIDMAALLVDGKLPSTGSGVSPIGEFDSLGTVRTFPACNATSDPAEGLPVTPAISATLLAALQARLTGRQSPSDGQCWSDNRGDLVARGYLTIDSVLACSGSLPPDPGYTFELDDENVLVGGFELRNPANNMSQGGRAVAVEARETTLVAGDQSFYGNYVAGTATDRREPLPPTWHVEFDGSGGPDADQADLLIWRGVPRTNPRACNGSKPTWYPMFDSGRRPYDVSGNTPPPSVVFPGDPAPEATPFAGATGRYPIAKFEDSLQAVVTRGSGEALLFTFDASFPLFEGGQAWVGVVHRREGRYSELVPGRPLDSFCEFVPAQPADVSGAPQENLNTRTYVFADDFEP